MSQAQRLAEALEGLFAHDHGWFTPFTTAIAGLSPAQAASIPAPRFNSVWAVVNHVWFWQEVTRLRLQGLPVDRTTLGAENGWSPPTDNADEQAWQAACERVLAVKELAARDAPDR